MGWRCDDSAQSIVIFLRRLEQDFPELVASVWCLVFICLGSSLIEQVSVWAGLTGLSMVSSELLSGLGLGLLPNWLNRCFLDGLVTLINRCCTICFWQYWSESSCALSLLGIMQNGFSPKNLIDAIGAKHLWNVWAAFLVSVGKFEQVLIFRIDQKKSSSTLLKRIVIFVASKLLIRIWRYLKVGKQSTKHLSQIVEQSSANCRQLVDVNVIKPKLTNLLLISSKRIS